MKTLSRENAELKEVTLHRVLEEKLMMIVT